MHCTLQNLACREENTTAKSELWTMFDAIVVVVVAVVIVYLLWGRALLVLSEPCSCICTQDRTKRNQNFGKLQFNEHTHTNKE